MRRGVITTLNVENTTLDSLLRPITLPKVRNLGSDVLGQHKVINIDCYLASGGAARRFEFDHTSVLPPEYIKIENRIFYRSAWKTGGKAWAYREFKGPEPSNTLEIIPH